MNTLLVFKKTEKGREEIEKRTCHIDFKRRTLLIVVDGESSAEALAGKTAHLGDSIGLLKSLWTEGFIEPTGEFAGTSSETVAQEAASGLRPDKTLDELKHIAVSTIEKLMGPDGDTFSVKLERTHNAEEFLAEARKTRDALKAFLGAKKADVFWKDLGF